MRFVIGFFLSAVLGFTTAWAGETRDLPFRFAHYRATIVVALDGTAVSNYEWSRKILQESALDDSKRGSIGYSTSAQGGEILTAYTLKADGRRIDVPRENYQVEVNSGRGDDSPVYSDWTTMTVVFPDVAVGDSVVLSYRLVDKEPMFPGQFSIGEIFQRDFAYDDIEVRIDYPKAMKASFEGREMDQKIHEAGDRRQVQWRWSNPTPKKSERRNYSVYDPDREVGYSFSTFANYAAIAAAYGERAQPKAAVTDRINLLATDIVKGVTARRAEAKALYEWVARNITYAGNCIGVGAVVPRDLDFVLDNKMGDCKDHATLLQALLAARGIPSTQALVNSGSGYGLPRIPVVFSVNHVINYLPEFDLFVDSTSDSTPFGRLPFGDQDKPVLLVDGYKPGIKTPVPDTAGSRQTVRSVMKIAEDGSITGTMAVEQVGEGAVQMRAAARKFTKEMESELIKNVFRNQGVIGSGKFEKDDPTALADHYRYKATFNAEKFIKASGAGAFYIFPPVGLVGTIMSAAQSAMDTDGAYAGTCTGGTLVEEYTIELPKSLKVLSVPQDFEQSTPLLSYKATYSHDGNILKVVRTLEDRTKGNVCLPAVFAEYKKAAEPVLDNLTEQVLYRR